MSEYLEFFTIDVWTLLFTWVNLLLLFLIVKKFLFKPINNILDKRQNQITTMYEQANTENEKATALAKEYGEKITVAKNEAGEIIKSAALTAQRREEEIVAEAKEKAVSMTQRAQAEIEQEKKKAYGEIKGEIAEISVAIAEKMVSREINAKDHEALITQFIENVGESR